MKNKTIALFAIAALLVSIFPVSAYAAVTLSCFVTTSETNYLWADSTNGDDHFTRVDYVSDGSNTIEWYRLEGSSAVLVSSSAISGTGTITPPSNAAAIKLKSTSGSKVYLTYAESTNPNSVSLNFDCSNEDSGSGGVPGNSGDCGCIFRTPGWGEYMGKIDDIIAAIPPAPDWGNVAGKFRDSIVPALIGGVDEMLGRAPSLPSQPKLPSPLDDGGLKKPTGQDSGLEGFDENDIKGGEEIEFREDESGGWDILDPIESMPEQETFIPEEGDLSAPEVPDFGGEAPLPEEPENPTPSNPIEPDNPTPTPSEPENPTPSNPKEPENPAPTPNEPSNPYPTPGENGGGAPTPSEPENKFPIPGGGGGTAPIPSPDGSKAPIPGVDNSKAPIPKQDNKGFPSP